jgi:glutamate formiminotransferase/glutamate formiminotransferase/formiminotetrahydrofolate cyclodeaminase
VDLLAVPNVSIGTEPDAVRAIGEAFASAGARLLDVHSDDDHGRSVFTLAGARGTLAHGLAAGAREAVARFDLTAQRGQHPRVGVLDVAPVVFVDEARRGAAYAEALLAADLIGEAGLPVFLYGLLGAGRTRAELRRGGLEGLAGRAPDFGPRAIDPRRGAVLVAARPPLVAFNLVLEGTVEDARRIAALVREGAPDGLPGVRALAMEVDGRPQLSTNVEDHRATPLVELLRAVRRHAPVAEAELVGLAPAAAFAGWPDDVTVRNRRTLEDLGTG